MQILRTGLSCAFLTVLAGLAGADTRRSFSGTECLAIEPADNANIARHNEGCTNINSVSDFQCGAAANVLLPISGNTTVTSGLQNVRPTSVELRYYDGNSQKQITCTIGIQVDAGTIYVSSTQNSASGAGKFTWTGSNLPHVTSASPPTDGSGNIMYQDTWLQHIYCSIPSELKVAAGTCAFDGSSYIIGYRVNYLDP